MDDFTEEGVFWLPDQPDRQVAGRLTFTASEGARLDLIGSLEDGHGGLPSFSVESEPKRIVGVAGRKSLTLDRCLLGNTTLTTPGTVLATYHPTLVLAGAHFDVDEPLDFYAISVTLTHLQTWTHHVGTTVTLPRDMEPGEFKIAYSRPDDEVVTGSIGSMELAALWNVEGDHITRSNITYDCYIKIEREEACSLTDVLLPLNSQLQNLLTLALDTVCYPKAVHLWHRDVVVEMPSGTTRPDPIELWFQRAGDTEATERPPIGPRMLFTYRQLGGLEGVYRWVEMASDKYRTVVNTLLANRYRASSFMENRFVNSIVAAEAFDRRRFTNRMRPKREFKAMVDEIISSVPDARRVWLREQLQYGNEPRLRFRLQRMADFVGDPFVELVGDVEVWSKTVVKARNDLAHGRSVAAGGHSPGELLYWLSESLTVLVALCLISECQAHDAREHLLRNDRVGRVGQRLRDVIQTAAPDDDAGEDEDADTSDGEFAFEAEGDSDEAATSGE